MGMKSIYYWISLLLFHMTINMISFLIGYVVGAIFGVHFFVKTHPIIVLLLFPTFIFLGLMSAIILSIIINNTKFSGFL